MSTSSQEQELLLVDELVDDINDAQLIVYNDDVNTFDWVIQCFAEVLGHSSEQSEQLALLIHFKGKATVLTASHDTLKPKKDQLTERGLSAVIEEMSNS